MVFCPAWQGKKIASLWGIIIGNSFHQPSFPVADSMPAAVIRDERHETHHCSVTGWEGVASRETERLLSNLLQPLSFYALIFDVWCYFIISLYSKILSSGSPILTSKRIPWKCEPLLPASTLANPPISFL